MPKKTVVLTGDWSTSKKKLQDEYILAPDNIIANIVDCVEVGLCRKWVVWLWWGSGGGVVGCGGISPLSRLCCTSSIASGGLLVVGKNFLENGRTVFWPLSFQPSPIKCTLPVVAAAADMMSGWVSFISS